MRMRKIDEPFDIDK